MYDIRVFGVIDRQFVDVSAPGADVAIIVTLPRKRENVRMVMCWMNGELFNGKWEPIPHGDINDVMDTMLIGPVEINYEQRDLPLALPFEGESISYRHRGCRVSIENKGGVCELHVAKGGQHIYRVVGGITVDALDALKDYLGKVMVPRATTIDSILSYTRATEPLENYELKLPWLCKKQIDRAMLVHPHIICGRGPYAVNIVQIIRRVSDSLFKGRQTLQCSDLTTIEIDGKQYCIIRENDHYGHLCQYT